MDRTLRTGSIVAASAAALVVAGSWASSASAQIIGLPTGADYSPYDTFAERWYDPGDWYGAPSRVGRQGGLGATSADLGSYPMRGPMGFPGAGPEAAGALGDRPPGYPASGVSGRAGAVGDASGPGPGMYPGSGGPYADPGAVPDRGFYEEPRMTGPYGQQDRNPQPIRPSVASGSPVFQQGYTPYQGWGYSDRSRDFYDPSHGGYPARAGRPAGMNFGPTGEDIGPGTDLGVPGTDSGAGLGGTAGAIDGTTGLGAGPRGDRVGTAGTGLGTAGGAVGTMGPRSTVTGSGAVGRGIIVENDALFEDYDSLYGGYGDYNYVERGSLPNPSYGVGPRYRGYYSDDWYSDSAAFDDWYDAVPNAGGALDRAAPSGGAIDGAGLPGTPGAVGGAADLLNPAGASGTPAGRSGASGTPSTVADPAATPGGANAPGAAPDARSTGITPRP